MKMADTSSIIVGNTLPLERMAWGDVLAPSGRWSALVHAGATPQHVAKYCPGIAYLATPYTREVMVKGKWNYERSVMLSTMASRHMVSLMLCRVTAISPIVQASEAIHAQDAVRGARINPLDHAFWTEWCRPILHACRAIVVPNIPGWDKSIGVWSEVKFGLDHNMPVFIYADRST